MATIFVELLETRSISSVKNNNDSENNAKSSIAFACVNVHKNGIPWKPNDEKKNPSKKQHRPPPNKKPAPIRALKKPAPIRALKFLQFFTIFPEKFYEKMG